MGGLFDWAPASIRYNNPGAMWPNPIATEYGATGSQNLADGNKIAIFPDAISGAAAQFGLLNSKYTGLPLLQAIRKWSGGNSSNAYAQSISQSTGLPLDAPLTPDVLQNPNIAIPLAKASARWEAGRDYPLSDDDWNTAFGRATGSNQPMALGGPPPTDTGDQPMAGGLLSAGSNMAKYLPPQASPITTGSVAGGPTAAVPGAATGGGLLDGVGDRLSAALQNPLFQFGVGMAGAGTEGKGIGGGLLGGAQNADQAYKTTFMQRQVQEMQQRDQFIRSLSDPNNPLSRSLSPETLAILKGLPPDQAAPFLGQIFAKNSELQYQRQYDLQNTQNLISMMRAMHNGNGDANRPPANAKQAPDGNYYLPDPNRPGKYLQWVPGSTQ